MTEDLGVSVVICAYTEKRWEQTCAAIKSVLSQDPEPAEVLLVVDHNPAMAERARTVDGRVHIDSPPHGPTTITVELPSQA